MSSDNTQSTHPNSIMRTALSIPWLLTILLAGCDGAASRRAPQAGDDRTVLFVEGIQHRYFPLTPGDLRTYEGEHDGVPRREEVRGSWQTRVIDRVVCTAAEQLVFDADQLIETSTEWFAQDETGNIWKFGEETHTVVDGGLVLSEDSWVAGVDGAQAWVAFGRDMQVGDVMIGQWPGGQDRMEVTSLSETATTPAGTFNDCLQVVENPDDPEDQDIILYAPGIGRVNEQSGDRERLQLVRWSIEKREAGPRRGRDVR